MEVKDVTQIFKNGKGPGSGLINNEPVKAGSDMLHELLTKLFNMCLVSGERQQILKRALSVISSRKETNQC